MDWSLKWKIKIAPTKTFALYLGKLNQKRQYYLDGILRAHSDCLRDLGILIDSKLTFSDHINKIVKSAFLQSNYLLRVLKTKNISTLMFAYKTYIRPLLEYASEVWNGKFKRHLYQIEKIQRKFTRRALKRTGLNNIPYAKRLQICNLEMLSTRRSLIDLTTTFKIIRGCTHLLPSRFYTFSKFNRRRPLTIQIPKHTTKTKQNFFIRLIKAWNKLPPDLLNSKTPQVFRNSIRLINIPPQTSNE